MNLVSRILNFISRTPFSKGFFLIPIILASLFFILASHSALAQGLTSPDVAGMGLSDRSLQDTIVNVINIALGFVSIIALAVIIYGGYVWMTSGGIPQRIALAKKILLSAVIGFIIILTSWAIVQFIFNATGGGGGPGPGPGPGPLPGPVSCMSWAASTQSLIKSSSVLSGPHRVPSIIPTTICPGRVLANATVSATSFCQISTGYDGLPNELVMARGSV